MGLTTDHVVRAVLPGVPAAARAARHALGGAGDRAARVRRRRRGISLVEMVLVLPILLLLTFGVIEYGGLFWRLEQIDDVTRQAARQAALADSTEAGVTSTISTLMGNVGLTGSGYTVSFSQNPGSAATASLVGVTVTVPYSNLSLTNFALLPVPTSLTRTVTMSKEGT